MIISLFGPDGVGKSTITQQMTELCWNVFSGTGVASWPDQTWHRWFVKHGIDETSVDDPAHFIEKIRRLHTMARELERTEGVVVIDSDPLHKTLMYSYKSLLPDETAAQAKLEQRFDELRRVAGIRNNHEIVHVFLQVSDQLDDEEQAKILHSRLATRETLAYFDPKTLEESRLAVVSYRAVKELLEQRGETVITVTTDSPFGIKSFREQLSEN